MFEALANGTTNLRLRCPTCSPNSTVMETGGLVTVPATHSFRPALKRATKAVADFYAHALLPHGDHRCVVCGKLQATTVSHDDIVPPPQLAQFPPHQQMHRIVVTCSCGTYPTWSIVIFLAHPRVFDFFFSSRPCVLLPERQVTFDNQDALRFTLMDLKSRKRLHIFADPLTLTLFTIVAE